VFLMYDDKAIHANLENRPNGEKLENLAGVDHPPTLAGAVPVTFRDVLAFENFILMMAVIFGLQFVDRSVGPVLPLYVEQVGIDHANVAVVSGLLFSIMAGTGAIGHHLCGKL